MVAVLLQSGRVLVTGASSDGLGIGNVDIYDPANGWLLGPKLPDDRLGAVAAPLPGGRSLLAGGQPDFTGDTAGPGPLASALTYNSNTNTWVKAPNMSVARAYATATALADGRVLVVGGYGAQVLASSQFFNPSSSTWTTGPSLAHARFGHTAVALRGGRVLVVGGADALYPERLVSSAELFDPPTGRWTSAGDIAGARSHFTLTALADGRALLTGGLAADGSTALRSTLLYDPTKNSWSAGPDLISSRAAHAAAILTDGRLLVTGGADQLGRLASSELYDSAANSWSSTGALQTQRSNHVAIPLANGRILVIAGRGSGDPLASAELYDPSAKGFPAPARTPAGPGRWQLAASKPISADSHSDYAQLLPDGRVLVVAAQYSGELQVYDPRSDAWTTPFSRKPPPCNPCGIGAPSPPFLATRPLADGKVLLLTIDPQKVVAAKAEIVDLKTGQATPAASPGKIGWARLDLLPDGRVWLTALQQIDRHALIYDPKANRWTATSDVPGDLVASGSDMQSVTAIPGGQVLVGGSLKAMVFNPATGGWAEAGSYPNAATGSLRLGLPSWNGFSALRLPSGDVLLAGGTVLVGTESGGAPVYEATAQVMRWDHATGKLTPSQNMPMALYAYSSARLADGRVLVAGGSATVGYRTSADPVAASLIYSPTTGSWSPAAALPAARSAALAVTLADGRVLLVGGQGMFGPPASLLFTP